MVAACPSILGSTVSLGSGVVRVPHSPLSKSEEVETVKSRHFANVWMACARKVSISTGRHSVTVSQRDCVSGGRKILGNYGAYA